MKYALLSGIVSLLPLTISTGWSMRPKILLSGSLVAHQPATALACWPMIASPLSGSRSTVRALARFRKASPAACCRGWEKQGKPRVGHLPRCLTTPRLHSARRINKWGDVKGVTSCYTGLLSRSQRRRSGKDATIETISRLILFPHEARHWVSDENQEALTRTLIDFFGQP